VKTILKVLGRKYSATIGRKRVIKKVCWKDCKR
jgi:hypothetical protein